ncbi:hypothetical protein AAFC00_000540 [Neodothiora populina]|uniref:Cupin type-2 domain-containing protein n=1 Tax=Neodothiora populina TaxID=2781224 RepID=A0ABR3PD76_9PEZI
MSQGQRKVHVVPSSTLRTSGGQTNGMARQNAITGLSSNLCASVMLAAPHSASDVHHHGPQDTVVYAVSGRGGAIVSEEGKKRQEVKPGDFALIPAWTEHREVNDGDEEVKWVITRAVGSGPVVQNLEGWGTS